MKQHWMVIPIDMKYDERSNPINFMEPAGAQGNVQGDEDAQGQEFAFNEAPRPVRNRLNNRIEELAQAAQQPLRQGRGNRDPRGHPVGTQYGFKLDRETQKQIDNCFETPALAEQHAVKLASENPGKQYGIFTCVRVFETTTPQVITKKFTKNGELALDAPGDQE